MVLIYTIIDFSILETTIIIITCVKSSARYYTRYIPLLQGEQGFEGSKGEIGGKVKITFHTYL